VFENRVFRKLFGLKKDEVREQYRILHNRKICDLYRLHNIVRTVKFMSL